MKLGTLVAITGAASAVTSVTALSFPRAVQGDGYLRVPVNEIKPDMKVLGKRDSFGTLLNNRQFYYSMDIQIGTPGQKIAVLLDTGSSELWVNPDCSTAPSGAQARQCTASGQYNVRNSRTPPTGPNGSRQLNYGDPSQPSTQTSAEIAYYSDTIAIGEGVIVNQTFGVVTKSTGISTGILGLAPDLRAGFVPGKPYSLLLNSMTEQNLIKSRVFSLDLRHANADNGALIFGGIDKGKYVGKLERVPIVNGARGDPRLAVELTAVGVNLSTSAPKNYDLAAEDKNVMLDSGTTLTRLHPSLARPILADLKAVAASDGYWTTDCAMRTPPLTSGTDSYVTFQFGRKTIRVPLSDFILDLGPRSGQCYVGLVVSTDQQILGDSVLRAGYFVFDWDNKAVHIAQGANCGKEEIVAVGQGPNAVPTSAVGLCEGVSGDSDPVVSQPDPTSVEPVSPVSTENWAVLPTAFSISFTLPPLVTVRPAPASSSELEPTVTATATSTQTLTTSSQTGSSTPKTDNDGPSAGDSSGNESHSAAASWGTESSHLGVLIGSLMTLVAVFWNT